VALFLEHNGSWFVTALSPANPTLTSFPSPQQARPGFSFSLARNLRPDTFQYTVASTAHQSKTKTLIQTFKILKE